MNGNDERRPGGWEDAGPGLLEAVWQYRWLVVGATLLAMVVGYGASFLQPTMYQAESRMLLADPRTSGVFRESAPIIVGDLSRYVRNQVEYVTSTPVIVRASELVDGAVPPDRLAGMVTAQPAVDIDLITVRALAPTPEQATAVANAVATAYQQVQREEVQRAAQATIDELQESKAGLQQRVAAAERQLAVNPDNAAARAERDAAVSQMTNAETRIEQISVNAALFGSGVELFEEAPVPESPRQPRPARNAAVAAVLGLLAAAAFSWWRAEQTQSADSRQDPAGVLGVPLLGTVPEWRAVGVDGPAPTATAPRSVAAEAYQFIVASLAYAAVEGRATTILVTSPGAGDGKTSTALNIAVAAAQDRRRVLLVDADERLRGLTRMSEVNPSPGLTDLGDEVVPFDGATVDWKVGERVAIPFVPAGSALEDPAGFFRTLDFRRAMERIRTSGDLIIIDSPPLLAVSDTSAIASHVDGIVLVISRGTSIRVLEETRERLAFIGTPVLGYVFNRGSSRGGANKYGYAYGYTYGHRAGDDNGRGRNDKAAAAARAHQPSLEADRGE